MKCMGARSTAHVELNLVRQVSMARRTATRQMSSLAPRMTASYCCSAEGIRLFFFELITWIVAHPQSIKQPADSGSGSNLFRGICVVRILNERDGTPSQYAEW